MSESTRPGDTCGGDDPLAELTDEFLRRHRGGERPSVEEYISKHPDLADRILNVFPAVLAMEQPRLGATLDPASPSERAGATIGRYKLLERIGEGGFGVVYMAEQLTPVRRKVALKVIKPGVDTQQVIARFEAERQALALMDHENIAKVLDAGATDSGRPYFVMELVHGVPITDYCDKNELAPRERLELFLQVCRAVQHAHTKGIIHRDIKPTNVLVTLHEGVAVPKVIDFGVAKATGQQLTEKTLFTNFAQMVGTPLYMSPEQAEMTSVDVDTRSDVYSLGVLLYELLTGTTPLDSERLKRAAFDEVRRIIREEEPPRPSTRLSTLGDQAKTISARRKSDLAQLGRLVRGELDWIVMKALEKQRSRRYETANGLARDIERYLRDEAVEACPPSAGYRFRKFASRNRRALVMGAIVLAALMAGTVVSTWQAIRATRAIHAERVALTKARESEAAAKQSEQAAVENAARAQRQQGRANRYFLGARSVVDGITERLNDSRLLQIPEIANIRKQLFQDLLGFYEQMVQYESLNSGDQDKAGALRMVGDIERQLGEPAKAEKAYRDAIALREPHVAAHPDVWESRQVLAVCYAGLGKLMADANRPEEAEAAYRRALGLWTPLATDHDEYGRIYAASLKTIHKALFKLLEDHGQHDAARAICSQLLEPFEQSAADFPNDVDKQIRLANALHWGGDLLRDTGRAEESGKLDDRARNLYRTLPATPATALAMVRFAKTLYREQKWAESEAAIRGALVIQRKNLPTGDPAIEASLELLTSVLYEQDKWPEDEKAERELLALRRKRLPATSPEIAYSLNALGAALFKLDKPQEAEPYLRESLQINQSDLSANRWNVAIVQGNLGRALTMQKKYDEAEALLLKACSALQDAPSQWQTHRARAFRKMAELYDARGDAAQAAKWRARMATTSAAATTQLAVSPPQKPTSLPSELQIEEYRGLLASALNAHAWKLITNAAPSSGDPRHAIEMAQEAVQLLPKNADYWNTLGMAQYRDGNWKEAIASLQKYRDLRTGDLEWGNPFFLAMAHWRLGNRDEARRWYDKGVQWMDKHASTSAALRGFRSEAAELLGIPSSLTTAPTTRG